MTTDTIAEEAIVQEIIDLMEQWAQQIDKDTPKLLLTHAFRWNDAFPQPYPRFGHAYLVVTISAELNGGGELDWTVLVSPADEHYDHISDRIFQLYHWSGAGDIEDLGDLCALDTKRLTVILGYVRALTEK